MRESSCKLAFEEANQMTSPVMHRAKSLFSLEALSPAMFSSCASSTESSCVTDKSTSLEDDSGIATAITFAMDVRLLLAAYNNNIDLQSSKVRIVMEPHLRRARLTRENKRRRYLPQEVHASIASSIDVPYTELRKERPFIFDTYSFPLHTTLAGILELQDLKLAHQMPRDRLLQPLLDRKKRFAFHSAYDSFLTLFCIPLLHSLAFSKKSFQDTDSVIYRYQAFPEIHVVRPGESDFTEPLCDTILGHSIGCLKFYVPLTPSVGCNSLITESHPGKEDWHPLNAKTVGLGYLFDGARCLHFDLENTSDFTRVALSFRIVIFREGGREGELCPMRLLEDDYSLIPGYYEEAIIDLRRSSIGTVQKRNRNKRSNPDFRVGYPFANVG
jgi:hypothetical protein